MKIYNLFPRLAGKFIEWENHLIRAAAMGFDWIFINPIQKTGRSGSLYSIADYFSINEDFVQTGITDTPATQVRAMIATAESLGMKVMIDLVINHCAIDSKLIIEHPAWFIHDATGKIINPFCLEPDGTKTIWYDLAQFDHRNSKDASGLLNFYIKIIEYLIELGFRGFRADAAYQIPTQIWEILINRIHKHHPDIIFVAETLGCNPEQTCATAAAGFDAIFNSSKWWDFESAWLLEQYDLTRKIVPSISFPESHDTPRLFNESGDNLYAMQQRYLFTALFSTGVMIPLGFEYGFRQQLNVVRTYSEHWESPQIDLSSFITQINKIKDCYQVFNTEGPLRKLDVPNSAILLLHKFDPKSKGEALLIINKDPWHRQLLRIENLYVYLNNPTSLYDVSLEWALDFIPTPFEFELTPGMGRILITADST